MRLLVFLTTTTIILICDVESFDHRHRLYQRMLENNITLPETTYKPRDYGNITRYCKNTTKKCIWKCCNFGESVRGGRCILTKPDKLSILNDVVIYDSNLLRTDKTLQDTFHLVPNHFSNEEFRTYTFPLNIIFEVYLSEDGILFYDMDNDVNGFDKISVNNFCIDVRRHKINFFGDFGNEERTWWPEENVTSICYRFIAHVLCIILLMYVLVMYCVRPHLRDLHGMLVITLLCCYLSKSFIEIHHVVFNHVIVRKTVLVLGKEMILYIYVPGMIMFLYNIILCCLIIPKAYDGFFGSLAMTYTYNDAIKYDVISFSQYMKLMTFITISEAANAYSVWTMRLYGIVSTNKWLLGVVIILIFLHESNAKRKCPTTPARQNMMSMTEMQ